jgi:hypothetical protein
VQLVSQADFFATLGDWRQWIVNSMRPTFLLECIKYQHRCFRPTSELFYERVAKP